MSVDKKGIIGFIVLVFAGSWLIAAWMWLRPGSPQGILKPIYMLMPGLAALLARSTISRHGFRDCGLKIGKKSLYIFAWLFPVVHSLFTYGLLLSLKKAEIHFFPQDLPGFSSILGPFANFTSKWELFFLILLISMTLGVILTFPFALGEEFGWRDYLLLKLLPLGKWNALIISGVIWGIWHAPLILMGHNFPQHPVAGVFVMIGTSLLLGIIFGWLRLEGGSVFIPAVAHASFNIPATKFLVILSVPDTIIYSNFGVTGWLGLLILVMVIVKTRRIYSTFSEE